METLFLYFGKMVAVSAAMSVYYLLFLRERTFHHYNRFYLLVTMVLSLFLPLLKVEYFTIETDSRILLLLNKFNQNTPKAVENSFNFWNLGAIVLAFVSLFLLAKLTLGLLKINQLKKEFPKESIEGITFYNTNLHDAPFSFFRNLFWKKSILLQSDLGKQILKHEMVHIEQKHSFDKLFVQIIQSIFWFNPIFYFIKKEITLIHEYLADKKAVKHADTKAFAQMLLASNFSGNILPATSPFLSSNIKKRLKMLTQKTTKYGYARRILALPILFVISFALLVNAKNTEIKKQNKQIAVAVQQLKKDTIKAEDVQEMLQSNQEKINKASEKLKKDNEKIATLSAETAKKSEELKKIAKEKGTDNFEYELKTKELERLGNEIDRIANSDDYKNNWREFELNFDDFGKNFNSEDFKNQFEFDGEKLKELEKSFNSKDFKNGIVKIRKMRYPENFDADVPPMPPLPPIDFEKLNNLDKSKLTKDEIKTLEKLAKEQEKLARKQAEIAKQQAEISRKYAPGNWDVSVDTPPVPNTKMMIIKADRPDNFRFNGKIKDMISENTKIYINGKLSTKDEMNKLRSENIKDININKNVSSGKEECEIKIQTK